MDSRGVESSSGDPFSTDRDRKSSSDKQTGNFPFAFSSDLDPFQSDLSLDDVTKVLGEDTTGDGDDATQQWLRSLIGHEETGDVAPVSEGNSLAPSGNVGGLIPFSDVTIDRLGASNQTLKCNREGVGVMGRLNGGPQMDTTDGAAGGLAPVSYPLPHVKSGVGVEGNTVVVQTNETHPTGASESPVLGGDAEVDSTEAQQGCPENDANRTLPNPGEPKPDVTMETENTDKNVGSVQIQARAGSITPGRSKIPSFSSGRRSSTPRSLRQNEATITHAMSGMAEPKTSAEGSHHTTVCELCQGGENDEHMLLCDGCDLGFHMYCLTPPLAAIPEGDWFCAQCMAARKQPRKRVMSAQNSAVPRKRRRSSIGAPQPPPPPTATVAPTPPTRPGLRPRFRRFTPASESPPVSTSESDGEISSDDGSVRVGRGRRPSNFSQRGRRKRVEEEEGEEEISDSFPLPDSAGDLLFEGLVLGRALGIYETLRYFSVSLQLSPFRFEDMCHALAYAHRRLPAMVTEIHLSLMQALLVEPQGEGDGELDEFVQYMWMLLDYLTWPELVRIYLNRHKAASVIPEAVKAVNSMDYHRLEARHKVDILMFLCDEYIARQPVRDSLNNNGRWISGDACSTCGRGGDLLCCDSCPRVYHLMCLVPPLREVPQDDWYCRFCEAQRIEGVTDCVVKSEKEGLMRQVPLGMDASRRRYWLISRRIFVECDDGRIEAYYSTPEQLEGLLECLGQRLDGEAHSQLEEDLVNELRARQEEIVGFMKVTERLVANERNAVRERAARAQHPPAPQVRRTSGVPTDTPKQGPGRVPNGPYPTGPGSAPQYHPTPHTYSPHTLPFHPPPPQPMNRGGGRGSQGGTLHRPPTPQQSYTPGSNQSQRPAPATHTPQPQFRGGVRAGVTPLPAPSPAQNTTTTPAPASTPPVARHIPRFQPPTAQVPPPSTPVQHGQGDMVAMVPVKISPPITQATEQEKREPTEGGEGRKRENGQGDKVGTETTVQTTRTESKSENENENENENGQSGTERSTQPDGAAATGVSVGEGEVVVTLQEGAVKEDMESSVGGNEANSQDDSSLPAPQPDKTINPAATDEISPSNPAPISTASETGESEKPPLTDPTTTAAEQEQQQEQEQQTGKPSSPPAAKPQSHTPTHPTEKGVSEPQTVSTESPGVVAPTSPDVKKESTGEQDGLIGQKSPPPPLPQANTEKPEGVVSSRNTPVAEQQQQILTDRTTETNTIAVNASEQDTDVATKPPAASTAEQPVAVDTSTQSQPSVNISDTAAPTPMEVDGASAKQNEISTQEKWADGGQNESKGEPVQAATSAETEHQQLGDVQTVNGVSEDAKNVVAVKADEGMQTAQQAQESRNTKGAIVPKFGSRAVVSASIEPPLKLGAVGSFHSYINRYQRRPLALQYSKRDKFESVERFKWPGQTSRLPLQDVADPHPNIAQKLMGMEGEVHFAFLRAGWTGERRKWLEVIHRATSLRELGNAMVQFARSLKPNLLARFWSTMTAPISFGRSIPGSTPNTAETESQAVAVRSRSSSVATSTRLQIASSSEPREWVWEAQTRPDGWVHAEGLRGFPGMKAPGECGRKGSKSGVRAVADRLLGASGVDPTTATLPDWASAGEEREETATDGVAVSATPKQDQIPATTRAQSVWNVPTAQLRPLVGSGGKFKVPGYQYKTATLVTVGASDTEHQPAMPPLSVFWFSAVAEAQTYTELALLVRMLDGAVRWSALKQKKSVKATEQQEIAGRRVTSSGDVEYLLKRIGVQEDEGEWWADSEIGDLYMIRTYEDMRVALEERERKERAARQAAQQRMQRQAEVNLQREQMRLAQMRQEQQQMQARTLQRPGARADGEDARKKSSGAIPPSATTPPTQAPRRQPGPGDVPTAELHQNQHTQQGMAHTQQNVALYGGGTQVTGRQHPQAQAGAGTNQHGQMAKPHNPAPPNYRPPQPQLPGPIPSQLSSMLPQQWPQAYSSMVLPQGLPSSLFAGGGMQRLSQSNSSSLGLGQQQTAGQILANTAATQLLQLGTDLTPTSNQQLSGPGTGMGPHGGIPTHQPQHTPTLGQQQQHTPKHTHHHQTHQQHQQHAQQTPQMQQLHHAQQQQQTQHRASVLLSAAAQMAHGSPGHVGAYGQDPGGILHPGQQASRLSQSNLFGSHPGLATHHQTMGFSHQHQMQQQQNQQGQLHQPQRHGSSQHIPGTPMMQSAPSTKSPQLAHVKTPTMLSQGTPHMSGHPPAAQRNYGSVGAQMGGQMGQMQMSQLGGLGLGSGQHSSQLGLGGGLWGSSALGGTTSSLLQDAEMLARFSNAAASVDVRNALGMQGYPMHAESPISGHAGAYHHHQQQGQGAHVHRGGLGQHTPVLGDRGMEQAGGQRERKGSMPVEGEAGRQEQGQGKEVEKHTGESKKQVRQQGLEAKRRERAEKKDAKIREAVTKLLDSLLDRVEKNEKKEQEQERKSKMREEKGEQERQRKLDKEREKMERQKQKVEEREKERLEREKGLVNPANADGEGGGGGVHDGKKSTKKRKMQGAGGSRAVSESDDDVPLVSRLNSVSGAGSANATPAPSSPAPTSTKKRQRHNEDSTGPRKKKKHTDENPPSNNKTPDTSTPKKGTGEKGNKEETPKRKRENETDGETPKPPGKKRGRKSKEEKEREEREREKEKEQLYCVCKTPYEEGLFYVGCDECDDWFHPKCISLTQKEAKKLETFVCPGCVQKKQKEQPAKSSRGRKPKAKPEPEPEPESASESEPRPEPEPESEQEGVNPAGEEGPDGQALYCICRKPYDDNMWYIGCDNCGGWFHGHCVGVTEDQGEELEHWLCPYCIKGGKKGSRKRKPLAKFEKPMSNRDRKFARKSLQAVKGHPEAWPFLKPVREEEAPSYHEIVKHPMDLSTMADRLNKNKYPNLAAYITDMRRIFDNCRTYNPSDTEFFKCADNVERFFTELLTKFTNPQK